MRDIGRDRERVIERERERETERDREITNVAISINERLQELYDNS